MPVAERVKPVDGTSRNTGTVIGHVKTAAERGKSIIAHSPTAAKAYLERGGMPLILPKDVKVVWQGLMAVHDMMQLGIDTRYQRDEITDEVNMLIHVLNNGGQIPDQVTIAERPDKSRWIVDGQQRFWAHVDVQKPMQARIFAVKSYEQELTLFHVLNNSRKLSARVKLQSWPKASGDAVRWLCEDERSALRGLIDFKKGSGVFPLVTVMRGLSTVVSGSIGNGGIDRVCASYDRTFDRDALWTQKATAGYATIVASVFDKDVRFRHLAALGLGRILHATWRPLNADDEWPMPTPKECAKLRGLDWDRLAPSAAAQWLPVVVAAIRKAWPDAADPDEYARSVRGRKTGDE